MRPDSRLLALVLVVATTPALRAQSAPRVDLSGDWRGPNGTASFGEKTTENGVDRYRVTVTQGERPLIGDATFDGQRLSFSSDAITGFICQIGRDPAKPKTHDLSFNYLRETSVDRLLGSVNLERSRPSPRTTENTGEWGGRGQIGATISQLDGFQPDRSWTRFITRNPLVVKIGNILKTGIFKSDDTKRLQDFIASKEARWGAPVTDLPPGSIEDYDLFRAQKAIALDKLGRRPEDVTEGFISARGTVAGQEIADRRIFWQRWKPTATPSGRLVVISPGFQETGRNFYDQIRLLNAQGDEVIVMDHQWAGYSDGSAGGLDRGYGVARDVAAVVAFAHQVAPDKKLVLFGNSMGGGPGALGAATLNDNGLIALDGPQMPKGVPLVLQAPFIRATSSGFSGFLNGAFGLFSKAPLLNRIPLPAIGLPVLTTDPDAMNAFANHASAEDVRAQTRSMTAANADLAEIMKLVDAGKGPSGSVFIVHEKDDPLADSNGSVALRDALTGSGRNAWLDLMDGGNHVLEESPSEQGRFLRGIRWVAR